MEFAEKFLPTAGLVGLLPMITWFSMLVAFYAFVGNLIFALMSRNSVAPEHRISRNYTAIIAAVAGISYFLIQDYNKDMLHQLAAIDTQAGRAQLLRASYNAIGQLRYMDWAITTPLLLLKMTAMLKVHYRKYRGLINTLLLADLFMIVTGYIGEQQLTADNQVIVGSKLMWGAISTVGYVVVVYILYKIWRVLQYRVTRESARTLGVQSDGSLSRDALGRLPHRLYPDGNHPDRYQLDSSVILHRGCDQ